MTNPFAGMKPFIGVFDSGVGGLSVLAELIEELPHENFFYFGDTAHAPYGTKTREEVLARSRAICDQFVQDGAKAIIIACNTATSAAASELRKTYDLPIIGMEPAVKPAFQQTSGSIVVLATEMTLREEKFRKLVSMMSMPDRVISVPAPELVTLVEFGFEDGETVQREVEAFVQRHLRAQLSDSLSAVVLGCTHFVFLKEEIARRLPPRVRLFDGNHGTAMRLKNLLSTRDLLSSDGEGTVVIENSASEAVDKARHLYAALVQKRRASSRMRAQVEFV
ncbi:MAG: glutamate racemase, partial [Bacillota bacterium]|nr:glutamate racemase [Bacillota bacterium]